METAVFLAFSPAILITAWALITRETRRMIHILSLQAATIGIVELLSCIIDVIAGLTFEAFIEFLMTFVEWISCVALIPFILYLCMKKTENSVSTPMVSVRKTVAIMVTMAIAYLALEAWLVSFNPIPTQLETLPLCILILSEAIVVTAIHRDAVKILVGLNMAINALYPLLSHVPLVYIAFDLGSIIFVNMIATFVIAKSFDEHKTLVITEWRE